MPPQLWLLRHGEAVPHDAKPDADRELTARGERQAIAAGQALARLGVEFAACYTSPKVRARDTARLALPGGGVDIRRGGSAAGGREGAGGPLLGLRRPRGLEPLARYHRLQHG